LATGTGGLAMVGTDGSRHVPIRTTEQLIDFFKNIRNSKIPSLEVKLSQPAVVQEVPGNARRAPGDRVEELEDMNFRISRSTQSLQKSVDELQRSCSSDRDEAKRLVALCSKELGGRIDSIYQSTASDGKLLQDTAKGVASENSDIRKSLKDFEKKNAERHEKVLQQLDELTSSVSRKFEDMQAEIETLKQDSDKLGGEDERLDAAVKQVSAQVLRLDKGQVQKDEWQADEIAMSKRITDEIAEVMKKLRGTEDEVRSFMDRQKTELQDHGKNLSGDVQASTERLNAEMKKLQADVESGISQVVKNLDTTSADLKGMLTTEVNALSTKNEKRFDEVNAAVKASSKETTNCVDELGAKTEATFMGMEQRMDTLVKAERSRLGNIEKDLSESTAKLRSDCRAEVERVRVDYEQEAARLDADLSDLHMKHDVVKQEINFFQSRLLEQRDWAQRQLAETATATRAAQVDAQEGVAAATKMAHVLRDDQVSFRDKMAKHISLLQHASDSYGDAINALETQRSRMRLELDAVLSDHKAYVTDMDGWADDVRVKVERLFRAMEPPRCEWRITGAAAKIKELKKPLALRSPNFYLQGLRGVSLELYPNGNNQSPDGKVVIRLCMPANAKVCYQLWLGKLSDGSREYESGGSLTVDLLFDSWKDQLLNDSGDLVVSMEVLQDLTNSDESLARAVRLES